MKKDAAIAFTNGGFHETVSFYHCSSRGSNRVYLSAAGVADGFKDHCKICEGHCCEKREPSEDANPRTKIAKPTITAKIETPLHPDDKPRAKLKKSIATKIETPQSSQSDDKSNAELKNSIATKIETPQPSQSNGKPSDEENMKSITAKTETSQSSQLDDGSVIKKAKVTIAAKMENPASVEFRQMKRAERKNAVGKSIDSLWLRQGENRVRRRDRRQAVSISCPRRRGVHRRLLYSYVPAPQYLQLRTERRPFECPLLDLADICVCTARLLLTQADIAGLFQYANLSRYDVFPCVGKSMRRREFISLIGGAGTATHGSRQQRDSVKYLGVLWGLAENDNVYEPYLSTFKQRLQDLGWIDGRNVRVEYRFTGGVTERIRVAARELVALAPDVIFATTNRAVAALLQETRTVPIVFTLVSDLIGSGFVPAWPIRAENYGVPQFRTGFEWEMVGNSLRGLARSKASSIPASSANGCTHPLPACD